ncbi:MAG: LysR family transcriptional regulator [Myxococcus sp.]|nr:LysR family transcriptional regulator [Myxococcus sp.]
MDAFRLNFHHLQYFWAVARDGKLTRTAQRLRVAQSALSSQIRQLEEQVGQPLFKREGRGLELTEAGQIALVYADEIFGAGAELVSTLKDGRRRQHTLKVGAVATLSRNFQRTFVRPLLTQPNVRLRLTSGSLDELLHQLERHALDVVLSNRAAGQAPERRFTSRRLARQPASIISPVAAPGFRFPDDLQGRAMILPGVASQLHSEFAALCERLRLRIRVVAEVDDMATIRLLARDSGALALVPSVVVRDELRDGLVHELCVVPELAETFYAISVERRFQHPLLGPLLERDEEALLSMGQPRGAPAQPAVGEDPDDDPPPARRRRASRPAR